MWQSKKAFRKITIHVDLVAPSPNIPICDMYCKLP